MFGRLTDQLMSVVFDLTCLGVELRFDVTSFGMTEIRDPAVPSMGVTHTATCKLLRQEEQIRLIDSGNHWHWRSAKSADCWRISRLKWLLVCFQSRISASHDYTFVLWFSLYPLLQCKRNTRMITAFLRPSSSSRFHSRTVIGLSSLRPQETFFIEILAALPIRIHWLFRTK